MIYIDIRIGLLFADLDTYRKPWAHGRTPEQIADAVLCHCHDEGIPTPSILVFSGRGIQAKWLPDGTLPRRALPRWNACQRYLVDRLAGLAAARARGRSGGRKPKLDDKQVREIRALLRDPDIQVAEVARRYGVSRTTLYKYVGVVQPKRRKE